MDISVSRLNKRMALELPPEFPLGLIFVVGEVKKLANGKGNAEFIEFCLSESDHLLNCRLSDRAAGEVILNEGDLIRAGGHLAFEPTRAGYYLLARDIEILSEYQSSRSALQRIITDKHERVPTTNLVPAEIPSWVEQLAPPEIRAELEERKSSAIGFEAAAGDVWELYARTDTSMKFSVEESTRTGFNADLIDFLSEAMDPPARGRPRDGGTGPGYAGRDENTGPGRRARRGGQVGPIRVDSEHGPHERLALPVRPPSPGSRGAR